MNEELQLKINTLKERINNLLEREEELKAELNLILAKDQDALTNSEVHRKERIEKQLEVIANSKENVLEPETQLLDEYLKAEIIIGKISQEDINKSVRTKAINSLASILVNIKKLDETVAFTEDDARKLQIERNNEAVFNPLFNNISDTVINNTELTIRDLNKELDKLERSNGKLDKTSNSTVKKIIAAVLLTATTIGVVKYAKKSDVRTSLYTYSETPEYTDTYEYDENATVVFGENETIYQAPVVTEAPTLQVVESAPTPVPTPAPTPVQTPYVDKEMDIRTRAAEIGKTGFFQDVYDSDIVELLNIIENKSLTDIENAGYAQLFNTTFNRIVEHYYLDEITENDINSVEALKHLAKENSDLDRFLTTFTELLKNVLRNPSNQDAKDKMIQYITIFGESLNGFTTNAEVMTDNKEFNENAQVNDFLNWWMAYDAVVKPTYPLYYPKALESIDGTVIESLMYMDEETRNAYIESNGLSNYRDAINKQIKLYELQYLMESALVNTPQYCEIVGYNYEENTALVRGN